MICVASRYWDVRPGSKPDKIVEVVKRVSGFADMVLVAVNVDQDRSGSLDALRNLGLPGLEAFPVQPWGFASAMNALLLKATRANQRYLLVHSAEIEITLEAFGALRAHMDDNSLCVGARLPDHEFYPGQTVEGRGLTVPWNTCLLWDLRYIPHLGFPLIGDAPFDETYAGVEELTTIGLAQLLRPALTAKLVEVAGIEWHTEFSGDPARQAAHDRKIRRKDIRPAAQIGLAQLPVPRIMHIK